MTRMDQWILAGAWATMAVVGSLAYYKVSQSPKIEPFVIRPPDGPRPRPPAVPRCNPAAYFGPVAEVRPADPQADRFLTQAVGRPVEHKPTDVYVLPYPVMGASKGDLDGVTLRWTTVDPEVSLKYWMTRRTAKATGFVIHRKKGNDAAEKIADLPPTATTYTDLSVEPRQTYRYWVTITGMESVRALDPPILAPVSHQDETPAKEVLPSGVRVKLVGGDRSSAILKTEFYDRAKKMWIPKTRIVAPGADIPGTGWTLKALRFDDFTLVANLTDDDGVDRVQTTR